MTIDAHILALFAFFSFFAFCSTGAFCFWYQHRTWSEHCDLIREMALAMGELRAYKNQQISHHTGKKQTGFWLFTRTIEKHLFLELRDGQLSRVIGDTEDLSAFPDLSPEQIAAVEALTAGIVNKLMHGPTVALRDAATRPGGLDRSRSRILRVVRPPRGRRTA